MPETYRVLQQNKIGIINN